MSEPVVVQDRIGGVCPIDLHPLPPIPVTRPAEVVEAVGRARGAQRAWDMLGFAGRAKAMKEACRAMLARRDEVVKLIQEELGKFPAETMMSEALGPLDYLVNWVKVVEPYLRPRKLPISFVAFPGKSGRIEIVPRGVIGIIAPWNFPLAYFFKPVFPALLCGNTVVVKPSEYTPRTAAWFVGILAEFLPPGVVQCVQGGAETGQALIGAGIDSLVFTGSIPTGRAVLRACAEQMIPCDVELGGKDAAIVLADCHLDRTVAGVMNWALANAGQSCGAIERVYVVNEIADTFVARLADAVGRLRIAPTDDPTLDVGPLSNRRQLEVVEAHVADAVQKGAAVLCGGKRGAGLWWEPTVLDRCDHTMKVVTEETFGPVIAVLRVKDVEEAIARANDSIYGLNASVWTSDLARAEQIARRLEVGSVLVNNHAITGAMAFAPWSGVKQTGYGVANSSFALAAFTRPRTILIDRNKAPDPWWVPLDRTLIDLGHRLAEAQLGRFLEALKVPLLLRRRAKTILAFVRPREGRPALPEGKPADQVG